MAGYQRKDFHTVTPYVYGRPDLLDFLKQAFAAEEPYRGTGADGAFHVELKIGDSIIMLGVGETTPREFGPPEQWTQPSASEPPPATLYLYTPDVDMTYEQALQAGAASLLKPENMPWGDRVAGVKDSYGNKWWIATHTGVK